MKYYRLNQIAMAVLGALLLFFGTRALIDILQHEPQKPVIDIAGDEEAKKDEKPGTDLAALLAEGDAAKGEQAAKKCAICHTFDKGGATLLGPNLYGVVGEKIASREGFDYSEALKSKEGNWDYANLDQMIANPNAYAPGTKMVFPGLPDAKERADVILFLRSKSDSPPPLPEVAAAPAAEKEAAEAPAEEAPAEGELEIVTLIATADPAKGKTDAALCAVCHTFDKGGAVLVGPNLYDIVGKDIASQEGVTYTPALTAKEGDWTYEALDAWVADPQGFASGTTMVFPGVADAKKRANIIAYLRSKSDNPVPLPAAEAPADEPAPAAEEEPAPAAEPEAPAEPEPAAEPEPPAEPEPAPPAEAPPAAEEEPAASEPSMGEPPSPSQPQPVYPDEAGGEAASEEVPASMGEPPSSSQPQPVYPDEMTDEPAAAAPAEETPASMGEPPSPSQPQPVYPDGAP